jgi:hypothetical protein
MSLTEEVDIKPKMVGETLGGSIDEAISRLVIKSREDFEKDPKNCDFEVTHIVTTPLQNTILVTVLSRANVVEKKEPRHGTAL